MDKEMDTMIEIIENKIPKLAKVYRKFVDCLVKEGFSKEQAINIMSKY